MDWWHGSLKKFGPQIVCILRTKDTLLLKAPHLKPFAVEDGRTTDEEDVEGNRDDAFAWPTHTSYDEQRYANSNI